MLDRGDEANTLSRQEAHPWNVFLSNEGSPSLSWLPWMKFLVREWRWAHDIRAPAGGNVGQRRDSFQEGTLLHDAALLSYSFVNWSYSMYTFSYITVYFKPHRKQFTNVFVISPFVWTIDMKPASYIDGARYTQPIALFKQIHSTTLFDCP